MGTYEQKERGECVIEYDNWHINHEEETGKYFFYGDEEELNGKELALVHEEYVSIDNGEDLSDIYGDSDVCGEFDNDIEFDEEGEMTFKCGWFNCIG